MEIITNLSSCDNVRELFEGKKIYKLTKNDLVVYTKKSSKMNNNMIYFYIDQECKTYKEKITLPELKQFQILNTGLLFKSNKRQYQDTPKKVKLNASEVKDSIPVLPVLFADQRLNSRIENNNMLIHARNNLIDIQEKIQTLINHCSLPGYVYIGKDINSKDDFLKIGCTLNLYDRLISFQVGQPLFYFLIIIETFNHKLLEHQLLTSFRHYNYSGENFKMLELKDIVTWLRQNNYSQGIDSIYRYNNNSPDNKADLNENNNNNTLLENK